MTKPKKPPPPKNTGIRRAIAAAGTQAKLSEALGLKQQTISAWLVRGFVPLQHVPAVHALTGIPKLDLVNPRVARAVVTADLF